LIERARSGDQVAFEQLVGQYRGEVQIHCYRFLGSLADAENARQETLAAAWRGLAGFQGRASFRTWPYRIATNRCLNMLRTAGRHPPAELAVPGAEAPGPTRLGEVISLELCPDVLLAGLPDTAAGPEARHETREAVSLAFITALQLLPPRQRVALILCDVLDFPARQAAGQELLSRLVQAFEDSDVPAIVALMTDDVWVRMPPVPLEYQGRELAARFFGTIAFRHGRRYRLAGPGPTASPPSVSISAIRSPRWRTRPA
jgi:RNA polymerase sigma-70 factor, ECF subfamily